MTGTAPRRLPAHRLASSVMRRAPVGSGTPGVSGVRRRDGSQALTVPAAPAAGSLSDLGSFTMTAGALFGDSVTSGSFYSLFPVTQTNSLADSSAASWDSTFGRFVIAAPGLWSMFAYVILDGTVTSGSIHVSTPLLEQGPSNFYNYGGDLGGGYSYAAGVTGGPVVAGVGSYFSAFLHANGTSMTIAECRFVLYPIALF